MVLVLRSSMSVVFGCTAVDAGAIVDHVVGVVGGCCVYVCCDTLFMVMLLRVLSFVFAVLVVRWFAVVCCVLGWCLVLMLVLLSVILVLLLYNALHTLLVHIMQWCVASLFTMLYLFM